MSWYDNVFLMKGYDDRFGDSDSENSAVLERCIIAAEEAIVWDYLPEWFDFESFKNGFKKLYSKFVAAYTEEVYWDEHAKWLDHELSY